MTDTQTLHAHYAAKIDAVLNALEMEGDLPPESDRSNVAVEPPRDPAHGDLATNAAMVRARSTSLFFINMSMRCTIATLTWGHGRACRCTRSNT